MELGRRVPLGQSRDSTTLRNPVVFELSPAMKLALGLRNPPFHPFSIPPFPTLGLGLSKEKQRYSVAGVETPASPPGGFQDRAEKEAGLVGAEISGRGLL